MAETNAPTDPAALAESRIRELQQYAEQDREYFGHLDSGPGAAAFEPERLRAETILALIASHRSLAELREQWEGSVREMQESCALVCQGVYSAARVDHDKRPIHDLDGRNIALAQALGALECRDMIRKLPRSTASPAPGKEGGR